MKEGIPLFETAELMKRLAPLYEYPIDLVLDTDCYNEVDDQFALAYALRSPELNLQAVYAAPFLNNRSLSPQDGMEKSYEEILHVLQLMGMEDEGLPVFKGADRFMAEPEDPVDSPAVQDLIARAMARPKEDPLYVAAIGCPVNVASALLICPDLAHHIVVVWLGGTARYWNQGVEFNLMQDLHASRVLLNCGVPLIRFPTLNVVSHLMVTVPELQHYLGDCGDIGAYLCDIVAKYAQEEERAGGAYSKVIWDVAVLAYLVNPDWVYTTIHHSPILNDDCRFSFDNSRHFVREAVHVDRDGILTDLYRKLGSRKI